MALFRQKLCQFTLLVVFMLEVVGCNKIRKLENGLSVLKEKLSTLEDKVYEDEVQLQYEIDQLWNLFNSSRGGLVEQNKNETKSDKYDKGETLEEVIKRIEERSNLLAKGFAAEKAELKARAKEFESEIVEFRHQHFSALANFTKSADQFMLDLNRTVDDVKNQINIYLEDKATNVMQRQIDDFTKFNKSLEEQFVDFKESIGELNNDSMTNLEQSMEQMKIEYNDLVNSLSLEANKTFTDNKDMIGDEIQKVKKAQEVTDSKTAQLDDMIKTVKDVFDKNTQRFDHIDDSLLEIFLFNCKWNGGTKLGNSCYMPSETMVTWQQAVNACAKKGARLSEANSDSITEFLGKLSVDIGETIWLGGSDLEDEGVWKWQTSKRGFTYRNWRYGEPNGRRSENCLQLNAIHKDSRNWYNEKWNDFDCDGRLRYVCEFEM